MKKIETFFDNNYRLWVVSFLFYSVFRMAKGSKKGRLTGAQRQMLNQKVISSVLDGDLEGAEYGRVIKHLGAGNIRVILPNKREGIAKIRNVLSRRGSTPIVSGDIVVLSPRDFETGAAENMRYDVMAVMSKRDASKLEKSGVIPSWMMLAGDGDDEGGEDIFDYSEVKEENESLDDDDIDKI
jgi:translation initiation factor IF-1